jgi:hypothetical protein
MPASAGTSTATGAPDDEQQETFVVCIAAMADGTYQVYQEDSDGDEDDTAAAGGADAGAMGAGGDAGGGMGAGMDNGGAAGAQTANSIEEALKIAGQMLQEEAGEDSGEAAQGDQGDGNAPVSDPQAVWNQLAKKSDAKRGLA